MMLIIKDVENGLLVDQISPPKTYIAADADSAILIAARLIGASRIAAIPTPPPEAAQDEPVSESVEGLAN